MESPLSHRAFDRIIKALIALKAAYMRERDPKRSCQIYNAGYRLVLQLQIKTTDRSCAGLRGFFLCHERAATCAYLLKLWAGVDPWNSTAPSNPHTPPKQEEANP